MANLEGEAAAQEEPGKYQGHDENVTAGVEPRAGTPIADGVCATPAHL